jgi:hypothetical protein
MGQMNRNAAYIYDVDGHTPWERLRVIRSFLRDRRKALALAELSLEEARSKSFESPTSFSARRAQIEEASILPDIEDCRREIVFLEGLEQELAQLAERTRVVGATDEEMYELNFFTEVVERDVFRVKVDLAAVSHVRPETMQAVLRNPSTIERLKQENLITGDLSTLALPLFNQPPRLGVTEKE